MRKSIAVLLVTGLTLTACSSWRDSRVNPGNWFGSSEGTEVPVEQTATQDNPLIPTGDRVTLFNRSKNSEEIDLSVAVASVTELSIEKTPTGAILYATGLASRQGAYGVRLKRNEDTESDTLDYSFRALYPADPSPVGSDFSRTLRVAVSLTHQDLAGVRLIRVSGAENSRETRR